VSLASEEFGANDSARRRVRGPCLVAHQHDPRSLRVVAGIRRCLGQATALEPVPLAEVLALEPTSGADTIVILPLATSQDVLEVITFGADLVERLRPAGSCAVGTVPQLIVVAPRAVLRHRRFRAALERSGASAWPDDEAISGRAPVEERSADGSGPITDPIQVLADRIASWGVTDATQLVALHNGLCALAAGDDEFRNISAALAHLNRAVPGFCSPDRTESDPALVADLRRLALEVRVVYAFIRICAPADRPHFRSTGPSFMN
jgi:hypothetical protein